jgi:transcriptional regulator with XRE-family HTH domain
MIQELLYNQIYARYINIRQASREIGVGHTTVIRILNGAEIDLDTLKKIAAWLGVEASTLLDAGQNDLASKILVFIKRNPELARELNVALDWLADGKMKTETLQDVLTYIAYRMKVN